MKTIISFLIIFGFAFTINGQNYIKMLKANSVNNYYDTYAGPPPHYSKLYRFSNDTIIGSDLFMEIEVSSDSINWVGGQLFLTEDTLEQKVFLWYNDSVYLLYDFSLELGDTAFIYNPLYGINTISMVVTDVDSVILLGKYHKTLEFNYLDFWIEGIGNVHGLLFPGVELVGMSETLVCYYFEDILIYKNDQYPACFFHSAGLSDNEIVVEVLFENNICKINSPKIIQHVTVFNPIGKLIVEKPYKSRQISVDLQSQNTGMYFINLLFEDYSQQTIKILK